MKAIFVISIIAFHVIKGNGFSIHALSSKSLTSFTSRLKAASIPIVDSSNDDYNQLTLIEKLSKPVQPGPHIKIRGMLLNPWGVLTAFSTFAVALLTIPFMVAFTAISDLTGDAKRRRILDWMVHLWANTALSLTFCRPKLLGAENLPGPNETVVYVPNHTSFVDILVLSGFIPRPFKYLSKSEIMKIPIIGFAMQLAKHVFIKRDDIRSTLDCTDTTIERLRDGNSMVVFAEGTRSSDGRLKSFKKGAFQMAKTAGVKVVPVSIGNLHRWMPPSALLPLAPIQHVYIKIHPAIDTANKKISEVRQECFEAVNAGLPPYQRAATAAAS